MPQLPARPPFMRQSIVLLLGATLAVALFVVGGRLPTTAEHEAAAPQKNVQARPTTSGSLPRGSVKAHRRNTSRPLVASLTLGSHVVRLNLILESWETH